MSKIENQINMDNYRLKKITLTADFGIVATYHERVRKDENVYWLEKTVRSMIHRHADMDDEANKYKIHVAQIYGLLGLGMFKEQKDMNDREKQLLSDVLDSITINSVTISGEDEKMGCVISAKRTVFGGKTIVMNTPFMKFTDEKYDFCYDMGEIYKHLDMEVYQYVFNRKFAQLELAFSGEEDTKEEEAVVETEGAAE